MTLSVGNNTNPLSLFLCWRQHFWTTRECLQRIPHRNSHLSCSSSNMSNHIISTTYFKSHVKDKNHQSLFQFQRQQKSSNCSGRWMWTLYNWVRKWRCPSLLWAELNSHSNTRSIKKLQKKWIFFFTWKMFIIYLQTKGVKLSFVCFQVQDVEAVLCDEAAVLGEK